MTNTTNTPHIPHTPANRILPRLARFTLAKRDALIGLGVLGACQCMALAQDTALRPPKVKDAPSAPKVLVYLVLVLLVAGLVFAATMKTKRGHQD